MNASIPTLTPAQIKLLEMMSFVKTPVTLTELSDIISNYFAQRLDNEIDKLWDEGTLNEEKVESFRTLHERTPYK